MRSLRIIAVLAGKHIRVISRSRATLATIFLPGIVLYSIFTAIFAGPAGRPFRVAVIDQDRSPASKHLLDELRAQDVRMVTTEDGAPDGEPLTVETLQARIRDRGQYRVGLVIPKGFGEAPNVLAGPRHRGVILYYDRLEPTEAEILTGMVQMAAGREFFLKTIAPLTGGSKGASTSQPDTHMLVKVEKHDVATRRMKIASKHTFLAGIVPMFLLFSAISAARAVLEALGSGEMRRLLAAPISPTHVLLGEMAFSLLLAVAQCYVMYVFAWLAFGVAIWEIALGLAVLTLATCLATTGFGVFVGAFCATSEQLDSIGTIVVLAMSAIGGSMVPRWVMPEWMQKLGLLTINGWSYDGFMHLIQGQGLRGVATEAGVLLVWAIVGATIGCLLLGRRLRYQS